MTSMTQAINQHAEALDGIPEDAESLREKQIASDPQLSWLKHKDISIAREIRARIIHLEDTVASLKGQLAVQTQNFQMIFGLNEKMRKKLGPSAYEFEKND